MSLPLLKRYQGSSFADSQGRGGYFSPASYQIRKGYSYVFKGSWTFNAITNMAIIFPTRLAG